MSFGTCSSKPQQTAEEILGLTRPATAEEIDSLPVGRVELERRRVDKNGKVKQKLSCVGINCNKCNICLIQFKEDELAGEHAERCKARKPELTLLPQPFYRCVVTSFTPSLVFAPILAPTIDVHRVKHHSCSISVNLAIKHGKGSAADIRRPEIRSYCNHITTTRKGRQHQAAVADTPTGCSRTGNPHTTGAAPFR